MTGKNKAHGFLVRDELIETWIKKEKGRLLVEKGKSYSYAKILRFHLFDEPLEGKTPDSTIGPMKDPTTIPEAKK